jgi:hypothetical protein
VIVISAVNREQSKLMDVIRANFSGLASADFGSNTSSASSSGGTTPGTSTVGLLKTAGDTMVGPLAFTQ